MQDFDENEKTLTHDDKVEVTKMVQLDFSYYSDAFTQFASLIDGSMIYDGSIHTR